MKTLKTRLRVLALVPLAIIALVSIGNSIGAAPDQTREVREAANGVGIVVQGGIIQGQVLRFHVTRLAIVTGGPPNNNTHPGGINLELIVFDSHGDVVASYQLPSQNLNGSGIQPSFFDLNAGQLSPDAFDNTGRAQLTGIIRQVPGPHVTPNPENCGFVASGEIFNIGKGQTLVHIAGTPISECR